MVLVSLFQVKFSASFTFTKSFTFARGDCQSQAGAKSFTSGSSKGKL